MTDEDNVVALDKPRRDYGEQNHSFVLFAPVKRPDDTQTRYKPTVQESGSPGGGDGGHKRLNPAASPAVGTNGSGGGGGTGNGNSKMMPRKGRAGVSRCIRSNLLTILTMSAVTMGVLLGVVLRTRREPWSKREIMYITFPGDLFLRMLKCLILPLIVSSMIAALGGLDLKLSGKIGIRAVLYYMATTVMAVVLGIVLVSVFHPGSGNPDEIARAGQSRNVTTIDTMLDLLRNMFPPNLIEACVNQYRTDLEYPGPTPHKRVNGTVDANGTWTEIAEMGANETWIVGTNETWILGTNETSTDVGNGTKPILGGADENDLYTWNVSIVKEDGMNINGLVVFAIVFGITIGRMGSKGKPLLDFFHTLGEAMMLITSWVIWLSPLGILFLVAGKMLEMDSFSVVIGQLGKYFLTVMFGLFVHGFIAIPLIYAVICRKSPIPYLMNILEALLTAFGTASSSATLPVTIRCLEDKNGVDRRVARFVLPIGATINMDGTALYEAVAALFIAQVRNVPMSLGKVIAVSITATAASIGAAGIPQAGLVTLVMVLNAVGLPAEDVTLIIVVDWLLDRFRTMINVLGDSVGAGIVNHLTKSDLNNFPDVEEMEFHIDDDKHLNGEAKLEDEIKRQSTTAM